MLLNLTIVVICSKFITFAVTKTTLANMFSTQDVL